MPYWLSASGQRLFQDPHSYQYVWVELYRWAGHS